MQQMFTRDAAPTTIAETPTMLEAVQLRVDYLGAEADRTYFEREERLAYRVIESAGGAPGAQRSAEEQAGAVARSLGAVYSIFILPRQPPRPIGQQDP